MSDYIKRLGEMADWLSTDALHYEVSRKAAVRLSADLRSLLSDVGRMTEALTLAANRLQRAALEAPHGSRIRCEIDEWADQARQALEGMGSSSASGASALHGRATDDGVKLEGE